jgi:hypothetical protein
LPKKIWGQGWPKKIKNRKGGLGGKTTSWGKKGPEENKNY